MVFSPKFLAHRFIGRRCVDRLDACRRGIAMTSLSFVVVVAALASAILFAVIWT